MQMKTTRYHHTTFKMANIEEEGGGGGEGENSVDKDVEKLGPCMLSGECNWCDFYEKQYGVSPRN